MTRDDWILDFAEVLIAAGRPRKLAHAVAQVEWSTRSGDDPKVVARAWVAARETRPGSKQRGAKR